MLDQFYTLIDAAIAAEDSNRVLDIYAAMSGFLLKSHAIAKGEIDEEETRQQYKERLEALL